MGDVVRTVSDNGILYGMLCDQYYNDIDNGNMLCLYMQTNGLLGSHRMMVNRSTCDFWWWFDSLTRTQSHIH